MITKGWIIADSSAGLVYVYFRLAGRYDFYVLASHVLLQLIMVSKLAVFSLFRTMIRIPDNG